MAEKLRIWYSLCLWHVWGGGAVINSSEAKDVWKQREKGISRDKLWLGFPVLRFCGGFSFQDCATADVFLIITTTFYYVLACSGAVQDGNKVIHQRGASREPASSCKTMTCPKV